MRLSAPRGYRWTDADVRYEKRDSFLSGLIVGVVIRSLIPIVMAVFS